MCRNGAEVKFDTAGAYVMRNGRRQPLTRRGSLHFLAVKLLAFPPEEGHVGDVDDTDGRPWR
eukprot:1411774-Heterocapsa_arctica.AAC.1